MIFIHDGDIAGTCIARYAMPKEINMNTAQDKLPSFRKERSLSPVSSTSSSKGAAGDIEKQISLKPVWMKASVIARTTREAGLTLYEILSIAELIRVAYENGEIEIMKSRLALLLSQAGSLSSILTTILELSRLEMAQKTTVYRYFDIVALLQEVSPMARLNIGQKSVRVMDVSSTDPITILSDPEKVRKIMMGLISNASKFTDRGQIALILNKDEHRIRLIITDTGRGMTAEQMNAAFAPSDTCGHAGKNGHVESGPGLRIIRYLVKLLEGDITISSKVGEGTIVEVSLPIEPSENLTESCRWMGNTILQAVDPNIPIT
jgi:signal transduction histidine kinase